METTIWDSKYTREKLRSKPDLIQKIEGRNRHFKGPTQFGENLPKIYVTYTSP